MLGRRRTGRRDVRAQPAPRAAALARGGRAADRRRDAPARPRSGRDRADRARHALARSCGWPGRCRGCCAASAPALVHTQYALPLRCALPGRRHDPRPLVRARPGADGPRATGSSSGRSCRAPPGAPPACSTVSERSKRDLVELYGVPPETVVVTPNGVDPAFRPGGAARATTSLSVGAIQPRKNQLAALEAAPGGRPAARRRRAREGSRRSRAELARARGRRCAATSRSTELADALPRRRLPRPAVALRGLRAAGARGDGVRHARSSPCREPALARGRRRRGRARRRGASSRTGSAARSPTASALARRRARARARVSLGARPPSGRSRSTGRRCARVKRLGGRRLPRARRRARAVAAGARAAGGRDRRGREPPRQRRRRCPTACACSRTRGRCRSRRT